MFWSWPLWINNKCSDILKSFPECWPYLCCDNSTKSYWHLFLSIIFGILKPLNFGFFPNKIFILNSIAKCLYQSDAPFWELFGASIHFGIAQKAKKWAFPARFFDLLTPKFHIFRYNFLTTVPIQSKSSPAPSSRWCVCIGMPSAEPGPDPRGLHVSATSPKRRFRRSVAEWRLAESGRRPE